MAVGCVTMLASEDRILLRQLKHGSKDALRRVYSKYRRELFMIAVALVGDIDLAEDCLREVFVRLAEPSGQVKVVSNLKAYLASCVVNRARDQIRREVMWAGGPAGRIGCRVTGPDPAQQLVNDERAAEAALSNRTQVPHFVRARPVARWIMKGPLMRLAVAAAMVMAGTRIGTYFFGGIPGIAWAVVLRKVNGFATCIFRTRTVETTGPRPDGFEFATEKESKNCRSEVYGSFSEEYENGRLRVRHYLLLQERQHFSLFGDRPPKLCMRTPFGEKSLQAYRDDDPRRMVARVLAGGCVEIGKDVIEGKPVRGVELRDPSLLAQEGQKSPPLLDDFFLRLWIGIQTELPVWMELSFVLKGSPVRTTTIWDQFQWGVPLEADLFQVEIPADYEIIEDDPNCKAPDSTPKTPLEEAFARHTLAEPYLGDFDHLELPDVSGLSLLGMDPKAAKPRVRLLGQTQIRVAHDACVAKWPRYEQIQAQLRRELQVKLDIDAMDVNGLVTTGIALRNLFWELGGCLSEKAYPYIYAARLLDEIAHEKAPDDPAIIDQLVESIVAYEVFYYWSDPAHAEPPRNPLYTGLLADLRNEQFALLKAKVRQGYVLAWKDFVRCCDLMTLSRWRKDNATALEVTRLLLDHAPRVGWTYELDRLKGCEESLMAGEGCREPRTFMGAIGDVHLAQYGRRLRSFQGPQEYRQSLVPVHLRHLRGW